MKLNYFFPTIVGSAINESHESCQDDLIQHCLVLKKQIESGGQGWISNKTYNTSDGKYEIYHDDKFSSLNNWVETQIKDYCNELDIDYTNLKNNGSWFNIYQKNDYQEKHVHPTSVISAIYILTCSDDGAKVFFTTPVSGMYHVKKTVRKQELADQIRCESIPGTLLIFPSHLTHAVERHDSDSLRITLSYNFKQL
jgi:uncharacterized protein (TIGR02466 family)